MVSQQLLIIPTRSTGLACPSEEGQPCLERGCPRKEGTMVRRGLAVVAGAMLLLSVAATARASNPNG